MAMKVLSVEVRSCLRFQKTKVVDQRCLGEEMGRRWSGRRSKAMLRCGLPGATIEAMKNAVKPVDQSSEWNGLFVAFNSSRTAFSFSSVVLFRSAARVFVKYSSSYSSEEDECRVCVTSDD